MDSESVTKAQRHADIAYSAARDSIQRDFQQKLAEARGKLAKKGLIHSSVMNRETTNLHAERLKMQLQARADALLEGYELHGVQVDEPIARQIMQDIQSLASQSLAGMTSSVIGQAGLVAMRTGSNSEASVAAAAEFKREMERRTRSMLKEIRVQVERKRLRPKEHIGLNQPTVTNVYHLHGNNSRVNVQSTDQSTNAVNISSDQVFLRLREKVCSEIPSGDQQSDILDRLAALERAQSTPSFAARYTDFISSAANHMTLVTPFIPALTEMMQRSLS